MTMKEPRKMIFESRIFYSLDDAYKAMRDITRHDYICEVAFTQIADGNWEYKITYIPSDNSQSSNHE